MDVTSTMPLHSGREMPIIGLGTWELTQDTADTVTHAMGLGFRMIDTAVDYYTQPGIGEAISRSPLSREEIYLETKVEENEDSYDGTVRDLEELDLDYADLVVIHRPPDDGAGRDLWQGLIRARDAGLTRDIGVSNYSTEQIEALVDSTGEIPAQLLIRWNLQLGVVPVPKASNPGHLAENLRVFDFAISDADMDRLNELNEGWSALGRSLLYA